MSELLFPLDARKVEWTSEVDQSWTVNEQTSASGKRRAISSQTLPAWEFSLSFPLLSAEEKDTLLAFCTRVKGSLIPFYYKDAESYKATKLTLPKNTDGTYQLVANMHGQQEPVYYVDQLHVYVDGTEQDATAYTVDRGAIKFSTAPASTAVVTASYEWYWKVCFADSKLKVSQIFQDLFSIDVDLKVVR